MQSRRLLLAGAVTLVLVGTPAACRRANPLVDKMGDASVQVKKENQDTAKIVPVKANPNVTEEKPVEQVWHKTAKIQIKGKEVEFYEGGLGTVQDVKLPLESSRKLKIPPIH